MSERCDALMPGTYAAGCPLPICERPVPHDGLHEAMVRWPNGDLTEYRWDENTTSFYHLPGQLY